MALSEPSRSESPLKAEVGKIKGEISKSIESKTEAQKQSKEAKNLNFQEDFRIRSNF